ncbi:coiled-coil domain-containing protein 115-like [Anneissia japonica]|uniref:coiled-coil domain-containing protein 115-like n=1 Tax=Anneissia japonica TaxID=1529436 RepID=UPI0014259AC2|nr:coiled-coil domain-containing protein 115-like [Anneissia japonica]
MADFNEICYKLDKLVIQYFKLLDEIHDDRIQLESVLKQGCFNLSKARYSMGNKAVGSLQYNSNSMKALAKISINEDNEDLFELTRKKPTNKSARKSHIDISRDDLLSKETTVRRRKGQKETDSDDSVATSRLEELTVNDDKLSSTQDDTKSNEEVLSDPIKWFGILVPMALRHGQSDFTQAITLCCHIANLQRKLLATKAEYEALYSEKQLYQEKSSDAKISS